MKIATALTILALTAAPAVFADDSACGCTPSDTACLSTCVTNTNSCIQACNGSTTCFESCIQKNWPGQQSTTAQVNGSGGVTMGSPTATGTMTQIITPTPSTTSSPGTNSAARAVPALSAIALMAVTAFFAF